MTPILNPESASPLYRQLMQRLRQEIVGGVYPVHSRIPSEQELCEKYSVSRVTVRKALMVLSQEGLLERRQGKGTFVNAPRLENNLQSLHSFQQLCEEKGMRPGSRLISAQLVPAEPDVTAFLGIAPQGPGEEPMALEIIRLRTADGEPIMVETNCFAPGFAWLMEMNLEESLYQLLRERGFIPTGGRHEMRVCRASAQEARLLGVNVGEGLLHLDQKISDQHGRPLHTAHQAILGDRFTFSI